MTKIVRFLATVTASFLCLSTAYAATFEIDYHGSGSYNPFGPYHVEYVEAGAGLFSLDTDVGAVDLSNILSFDFSTTLVETVSTGEGSWTYPPQTVSYGLGDLVYFEASLLDGLITSYYFVTAVKDQPYGDGSSVFFVGDTGQGVSILDFGAYPTGPLTISPAAVPEPGAWAMMIAGFGLIGIAARRRYALAGA
jgi:hypothetical protein